MELLFSQDQPAAVLLRARQQAMRHDDVAHTGHPEPFDVAPRPWTQPNMDDTLQPVSQKRDGIRGPAWKSLQFHSVAAQCLEVVDIGEASSSTSAQRPQFADEEKQLIKTRQEEQNENELVKSIGLNDEYYPSDEDVS